MSFKCDIDNVDFDSLYYLIDFELLIKNISAYASDGTFETCALDHYFNSKHVLAYYIGRQFGLGSDLTCEDAHGLILKCVDSLKCMCGSDPVMVNFFKDF